MRRMRRVIQFFIVNDGSPIDFYISHGNKGVGSGRGQAEIKIENVTYINGAITDSIRNTMWFYQKPVSPRPQMSRFRNNYNRRSWDETLHAYLREIGAE